MHIHPNPISVNLFQKNCIVCNTYTHTHTLLRSAEGADRQVLLERLDQRRHVGFLHAVDLPSIEGLVQNSRTNQVDDRGCVDWSAEGVSANTASAVIFY